MALLHAPVFSPLEEGPLTWPLTELLQAPAWRGLAHTQLPSRIQVPKSREKGPWPYPIFLDHYHSQGSFPGSEAVVGVLEKRSDEWLRYICHLSPSSWGDQV